MCVYVYCWCDVLLSEFECGCGRGGALVHDLVGGVITSHKHNRRYAATATGVGVNPTHSKP